ncbi:helix-turn-helix transcriptional regulator [Pseudoalteromonas luteoviolacea]|uniref:helix-turn-helix transcriptional regulator n=1 Tax=Pseudoalteromonas luteoviolacea TaxID=43657 RepID=UPI001B3A3677|nr:helix-turn-helix transcriptional regulator [Pseudoalteromonas luteoviolacea]MBQ4879167.1 helix-turn-helix transcriptional regulator [Pseudoalteromonas luteoviolacea]MBQ4908227.1 helix-turn-helix transcriptional regulator [Pseudoalteromonas luteoviolacea]
MIVEHPSLFALNVATLCVIIFSAHQLILRVRTYQIYWPLAVCLLAIGLIAMLPISKVLLPIKWQIFNLITSLPALLLIAPSLWLYAKALTSSTPWQLSRHDVRHLIPACVGSIIAFIALCLPARYQHGVLVSDELTVIAHAPNLLQIIIYGLLIMTFVCVLGWVVQSAWYFYKILSLLRDYHIRLKDVFASTEQKELHWLVWLLTSVGGVWLFIATNLVLNNLLSPIQLSPYLHATLLLLLVYSLSLWGLRQKPGFAECYHLESTSVPNQTLTGEPTSSSEEKYQRSALDTQKAQRIATKLQHAMHGDKLYLDAALSLPKLAAHIHAPSHYISQTLNETLDIRFFDFVNQHRVDAAKQSLIHSDKTILDVAMSVGFNSKSAFYTAFKKHTGMTPSAYRKKET